MLKNLVLKNFALIRELSINFSNGFTVISGETGSGKSIMFDALGLLLGNRADASSISTGSTKSIIEATFETNASVNDFLITNGFEPETEILLRRELNINGKTRTFINDSVANLQQMKSLGELLVDIHAQHETLLLNRKNYQLNLLDSFAQLKSLKENYQQTYTLYQKISLKLENTKKQLEKEKLEAEFINFQLTAFENLRLNPNEVTHLESELLTLENASSIKQSLIAVSEGIDGENQNAVSVIRDSIHLIRKILPFYKNAENILERLETVKIELQDIAQESYLLQENISVNENDLINTQNRLDEILGFMQKHKLENEEALNEFINTLKNKSQNYGNIESEIIDLEKESTLLKKKLFELGKNLSEKRKSLASKFCNSIKELLVNLDMENANVLPFFEDFSTPTINGFEQFSILIATAKGSDPKPIEKVASGGEMSRIMLSLKILLANLGEIPTLVFDEIETGVSGKVADKMGKLLVELSKNCQVISITHLPQIAAMGSTHLKAYKKVDEKGTFTQLLQLSKEEKINEIAAMLSGDKITKEAIENAKALLS